MVRYSLVRLVRAVLTMWGVVTLVFIIPRFIGDPVSMMAPLCTETETLDVIRKNLGLDRPVLVQYGSYMANLLRGDFGESFLYRRSITSVIGEAAPPTIQLAGAALLWSLVLGLPLGIISAVKRGTVVDHIARTFAVLGQTVPNFVTAIILILFFAVRWQVFPYRGPDVGLASLHELILPSLALGWVIAGPAARLTRSSMLEVLNSDYVTMARMKGLKERVVMIKHAFKNALLPVITFLGLQFGYLLGGVVIIETIFGWPGLGRAAAQAIFTFDFPLVQAITLLGAATFIVANYLVDISYGVIDPRVRY